MTRDHLLLIGHGSLDEDGVAENMQFAEQLGQRLGVPVAACFLEFAEPPIVDGIVRCVREGAERVLALPLFLGAGGHQKNDVPALLNWAKAQWPQAEFRYGAPLGAQYPLVQALAERAAQAVAASPRAIPAAETALLVVGRGSRDPDSNSEVSKMARLLWEGRDYGWAEACFYSLTTPDVAAGIERCVRLGARRVVVLPYLLFTGKIHRAIEQLAAKAQARYPDVEILAAQHIGLHEGAFAATAQRYHELLAGQTSMSCDICKYRQRFAGFEAEHGMPQRSDHHHGMRGVPHSHDHGHSHSHAPVESILPPRYQGGRAVSAAPMSAAPLVFDEQGRPAWDKIWGSDDPDSPFCELALAGGPPHRGSLLEPALPAAVAAAPEAYARVVAELARAIGMVTGLRATPDAAPGWVGVECDSEDMAVWLLRAIVVENVCVRREGRVLLLPAGPDFRLEAELKNVVTALAKTHHYWKEHLFAAAGR